MKYVHKGEKKKIKFQIRAHGFNMLTDDFKIDVCRGNRAVFQYMKSDLKEKEDGFYLLINTQDWEVGQYSALVTAYVPDDDFADGIRIEKDTVNLFELIL